MVKWSVPARNDLKQIHDYIAKDSKYYARKVIQEIVAKNDVNQVELSSASLRNWNDGTME